MCRNFLCSSDSVFVFMAFLLHFFHSLSKRNKITSESTEVNCNVSKFSLRKWEKKSYKIRYQLFIFFFFLNLNSCASWRVIAWTTQIQEKMEKIEETKKSNWTALNWPFQNSYVVTSDARYLQRTLRPMEKERERKRCGEWESSDIRRKRIDCC